MKKLALNTKGDLTYCTSNDENIGKGRCNHILHQNNNESVEEFMERATKESFRIANKICVKIDDKTCIDSLKIDGIQTKYYQNNKFIKEDLDIEEKKQRNALSEEIVSLLLDFTDIEHAEYKSQAMFYEDCKDSGKIVAVSPNFLKEDESLVSLENLLTKEQMYQITIGESNDYSPQFKLLKHYIYNKTGLDIHSYLLKTISLDLLTLNGDRHLGNIALKHNSTTNKWSFAPLFDNGDSLFSDISYDDKIDSFNFWDYGEESSPSTFGVGPLDDYFDLLSNELKAKDAIRIDYDKFLDAITKYKNNLYDEKYVNRSKDILIQRLEEFENILWIKK